MRSRIFLTILCALVMTSFASRAGIVVSGTRVIYPADKKEVTVSMKNTGQTPALVQSWIDTGDPTEAPQNIQVPFVLMPPFARIDGGKGQTLRLIYTGGALPQDRESVFWLNILSVPPKKTDSQNQYLNVAYQTRIKLFYRPAGLNVRPEHAGEKLQWKREAYSLSVFNPTPYYISLMSVAWSIGEETYSLHGEMVAPFSTLNIQDKEHALSGVKKISFGIINDQGVAEQFSAIL